MKVVAAAKYNRAEKELKPAKVYGKGALGKYVICNERNAMIYQILFHIYFNQ